MAHFARALHSVAHETDSYLYFMSLVGLSNRKGRCCFRFFLCRYVQYLHFSEEDTFCMMPVLKEDMKEVFNYDMQGVLKSEIDAKASFGALWPLYEHEVEKAVLLSDGRWVDALPQLYDVVVSRWYEDCRCVKVSVPRKWRRKSSKTIGEIEKNTERGKKTRLRFSSKEELKIARIRELKERRSVLWRRRRALKIYNTEQRRYAVSPLNQVEYDRHGKRIERINRKIATVAREKSMIDLRDSNVLEFRQRNSRPQVKMALVE